MAKMKPRKEIMIKVYPPSIFSDDERKQFELITKATSIDMATKKTMSDLYRKFIDASLYICLTCDDSVRLAFGRVKKYWDENKTK